MAEYIVSSSSSAESLRAKGMTVIVRCGSCKFMSPKPAFMDDGIMDDYEYCRWLGCLVKPEHFCWRGRPKD